jgi:hypothetical protein
MIMNGRLFNAFLDSRHLILVLRSYPFLVLKQSANIFRCSFLLIINMVFNSMVLLMLEEMISQVLFFLIRVRRFPRFGDFALFFGVVEGVFLIGVLKGCSWNCLGKTLLAAASFLD